ncbi:aspartic proteinase nepenthesin-1-like [Carex rostrata]
MKVVVFWLFLLFASASLTKLQSRITIGKVADGADIAGNVVTAVCIVLSMFGACNTPLSRSSVHGDQSALVDISSGVILMNFSVGNTNQKVSLIVDTTLDFTFILCQPYQDSSATTNIDVYNSNLSDTFKKYSCEGSSTGCFSSRYTSCKNESCTYHYNDYPAVTSQGILATDTFFSTNDDAPAASIVFSCGTTNTGYYGNSVGYVGLGLGNLSIVSQLNFSIFSYCFSFDPSDNRFFLGPDVRLHTSSSSSIKLLPNVCDPALYYVNMTGITVGGKRIDIPSTAYLPQPDGCGGMVDTLGGLPQADASAYDLDLCFAISPKEDDDMVIPDLTLHFDGADMNPDNYFMKDSAGKALCLMVVPAEGISILGNLMQMEMKMVFDIANSVLPFESVNCRNL